MNGEKWVQSGPVFAHVAVNAERLGDGSILLSNGLDLPPVLESLSDRLRHWAIERPDQIFLTQRTDDGSRAGITYAAMEQQVSALSARLVTLPLSVVRPMMIVGINSLNHAGLLLAAMRVGVPVAIVSTSYCAVAASPWDKLRGIVEKVDPGVIVTDDPAVMKRALGGSVLRIESLANLDWLLNLTPATPSCVDSAMESTNLDSVAKLLFTSGSTGSPKAVVNTQRMMVSNMLGLDRVWPFLRLRPPVLVDWLPWNHTFGGNCCFNLALFFGGTLHIDDGKPTPALVGRTLEAIRALAPTVYFNVPAGYAALLPALESDIARSRDFLGRLDFLFNAGAALPQSIRTRIESLSRASIGRVPPIVGGWGSTETAPFSTVTYFKTDHAENLGVPLPGVTIKLVPVGDRHELRVRGPNVTPGYWKQQEATDAAFDDEGYLKMGDAARFADPARPDAGLLFAGRLAENFKLSSGTWVNVGPLRLAIIAALDGFVADVVVAGEGRDEIGLLIFPTLPHAGPTKKLQANIAAALRRYNAEQFGSSTRVARFILLDIPPNADAGEITDKGYLNQREVLARRSADVANLFENGATL